jgi:hypothetical protein
MVHAPHHFMRGEGQLLPKETGDAARARDRALT